MSKSRFHNLLFLRKKILSDPNIIVEENKLNVVGYMSELNYRNHISFTDQGYNLLDIVIKSEKVNNDYLFREIY